MPYSPLQQSVEKTALAMCEGLASPVSLGVALRIKHGEWDDLASMRVDPKHYLDASAYARDNQCVSFLRKYQELPTTVDREAVALETFWLLRGSVSAPMSGCILTSRGSHTPKPLRSCATLCCV